MATAPVKPHPLHNFPLSLKWGQSTPPLTANASPTSTTTTSDHRSAITTRLTPPPTVDSETESEREPPTRLPPPPRVGSRRQRSHRRFNFTSCSAALLVELKPEVKELTEKLQKQLTVSESSKDGEVEVEEEEEEKKGEEEGANSRPWKLRPRRGSLGGKDGGGRTVQIGEQREKETLQHQQQPKSMRLRGMVDGSNSGGNGGGNCGGFEKKEKRKFWIALAREEIEEDIFILTGSRPVRRPKKRPKNVQKVLDSVFPGLWLVGATADSYRIAEAPVKVCPIFPGRYGSSYIRGFIWKHAECGRFTPAIWRPHMRLPYIIGGQSSKHIAFL